MTRKPYDATPPTKEGEVVAEEEKEKVLSFFSPLKNVHR